MRSWIVVISAVFAIACNTTSSTPPPTKHDPAPPTPPHTAATDTCSTDADCTVEQSRPCCYNCGGGLPSRAINVETDKTREAARDAECAQRAEKCPHVDCAEPACEPSFAAKCERGRCTLVASIGDNQRCGSGALPVSCGAAPPQNGPCAQTDTVVWASCVCHARGGHDCDRALAGADPKCTKRPPSTWTSLRIEALDAGKVMTAMEVTPDRVVFGWQISDNIPTTAVLTPDVRSAIDAWHGPAPSTAKPGARWTTRFVLRRDHAELTATYDTLPPAEAQLDRVLGALVNTPRTPLPCKSWDGAGAFTLSMRAQDFGYVPGPVEATTIASDGTVTHRRTGNPDTTATATPAEIEALRAALHAVDFNQFKDIWGGAGEGSNLRAMRLTWATDTCGRAFTNDYPAAFAPVFTATKPIVQRLR